MLPVETMIKDAALCFERRHAGRPIEACDAVLGGAPPV